MAVCLEEKMSLRGQWLCRWGLVEGRKVCVNEGRVDGSCRDRSRDSVGDWPNRVKRWWIAFLITFQMRWPKHSSDMFPVLDSSEMVDCHVSRSSSSFPSRNSFFVIISIILLEFKYRSHFWLFPMLWRECDCDCNIIEIKAEKMNLWWEKLP
jgi:hypothetical protein